MSIETDVIDTIKQVRNLYQRFNDNNGNIIDITKVDNALSNIIVVGDSMNNAPNIVREYFIHGSMAMDYEGKIYIKKDVSIDILFHEILHNISEEHIGISYPLLNVYDDKELDNQINKYGEDRTSRQIEQLNESLTRFITEQAIPEIEISDSYKYGAEAIRKYYDILINNGVDASFIYNMYINGNEEDVLKFKNSFGNKFIPFLEAIERINNVRFYILKKPIDPTLSSEELEQTIIDAANNIITRQL